MTRFQRRYLYLKGQGRCVRCAEKLPPACETLLCPTCWDAQNAVRGRQPSLRKAKLEEQIAHVVATAHTQSIEEQAKHLGVTLDRLYGIRAIARKRGNDVPVVRGLCGGNSGGTSVKWAELDNLPRCPHCSLLLPHETCLKGNALDRRGPGAVFPDLR